MDGVALLSFVTLLVNIGFVFVVSSWLVSKYLLKGKFHKKIEKYLAQKSTLFAFVVSLTAMLGSLYFSEIRGFTPCKFCWLQRIFMYPLPFILGVALFKKTKDVFYYVLPLSLIGVILGSYHYYIQLNPNPLAPCTTVGFSVSCSDRFFTHYGYITIPFMALSAFVVIFFLSLIKIRSEK